jgi:pimeloyl-ACP methyl ester carboxylesterase
VSLAFDRRGTGEPLVLLHPLGGDRGVWAPVFERLACERDVIAVDMPGFGESAALPDGDPATPAALADAVAGLMADLGVERPHVAGNSLGGWVALELALRRGARSVTAIAPAGLWPQPLAPRRGVARSIARAALPVIPALVASEAGRRVALIGTVAHPERVEPAAAARLVRSYARAPGFDAANDAMRADRFSALERIRVPLTLGWPEYDRLVARPPHLPARARSVVLRGCGHMPMWDDPEQVADLLLAGSSQVR